MTTNSTTRGDLAAFSSQLADAVERAGHSVARVEARRRQSASGVAWSADGLIVTANHVIERDEAILVGLPSGARVEATIVGRDAGTDLAVLRATGATLTPIDRGPTPRVGELTLMVARPDQQPTASHGIVVALGGSARTRRGGLIDGYLRTDGAMLPGFSGGPLIDVTGRLIGLTTSYFGGGGFALARSTVERVAQALIQHGKVRRGFLGVTTQPVQLPATSASAEPGAQSTGLLVVGVAADGPAAAGGVIVGDIIVGLAGQAIRNADELQLALHGDSVGQPVALRIWRGGDPRDLTVTPTERE